MHQNENTPSEIIEPSLVQSMKRPNIKSNLNMYYVKGGLDSEYIINTIPFLCPAKESKEILPFKLPSIFLKGLFIKYLKNQ